MCPCPNLVHLYEQGQVMQKRKIYLMEVPKVQANRNITDATALVEFLDITEVHLIIYLVGQLLNYMFKICGIFGTEISQGL